MPDELNTPHLPPHLEAYLREANPWWADKPGRILPPFRRWAYDVVRRKLDAGLAPIVLLRGPRQVGKTTLQEQIIHDLIASEGVEPGRILRVQFDEMPSHDRGPEPILDACRWFQAKVLGCTFNEAAHAGKPAMLFFDEVQTVIDWAPQLKILVDHHTVKGVATGSSALQIEAGRDSLAGRVTTVEMGTLLLREVAALRFGHAIEALLPANGLASLIEPAFWWDLVAWARQRRATRDEAFAAFADRGGFPTAQTQPGRPWEELADQLNETVIQKLLRHDLLAPAGAAARDPDLLEEVLRIAFRYAGQAPGKAVFVQEIKGALGADIRWDRILNYLRYLDRSLLIRLVPPVELRLKRMSGQSKLCLCDHGLRASWLQEKIPLTPETLKTQPELADLAGHLAESIAGYYLAGLPHLDIAHFPQRNIEPEVDFVLTVGETRIPMEVKYRQRIDPVRDTLGLRAFIEKTVYRASFGVLVTMHDDVTVPDPRIVTISLPSLLLMR